LQHEWFLKGMTHTSSLPILKLEKVSSMKNLHVEQTPKRHSKYDETPKRSKFDDTPKKNIKKSFLC
jgi:hypothetical protein